MISTTTAAAIRANIISTIEALTPTRLAGTKFRRFNPAQDLADQENITSQYLRNFLIEQPGGNEVIHHHGSVIYRSAPWSVMVVYPPLPQIAGDNLDALRDMLDEDYKSIRDALFDPASYLAGQCLATPAEPDIEETDDGWFLTLNFSTEFYESATFTG